MDKFLDTYDLSKLNQENINNLNRYIMSKEIERVIIYPCLDKFTAEFYQTFKEELTPVLLKLFQKLQREGIPSNSFNETRIILLPKLGKDTTKRKLYNHFLHEYRHKKIQ
jgi:hypothetical protein